VFLKNPYPYNYFFKILFVPKYKLVPKSLRIQTALVWNNTIVYLCNTNQDLNGFERWMDKN